MESGGTVCKNRVMCDPSHTMRFLHTIATDPSLLPKVGLTQHDWIRVLTNQEQSWAKIVLSESGFIQENHQTVMLSVMVKMVLKPSLGWLSD